MMIEHNLLFKVVVGTHEYKVFTDGSISGFGDDPTTFVFNLFPTRVYEEIHELKSRSLANTLPQTIETESLSG